MAIVAFQETQLDVQISFKAQGGPMFKTTILTLASGFERRNVDWAQARGQWDIAYGIRTQIEMDKVRSLFMSCCGRAGGFRFRDPMDYNVPRTTIGQTDGSKSAFQLFKHYATLYGSYDRKITKPVAGTSQAWINGSPATLGVDYTLDTTTGILTILSPHVATTGQNIEVQCQYDVPVRFDSDHFTPTLIDHNAYDWTGIVVVELRQ